MSIIRDFIQLTPCRFFDAPPVRRCLIRFIRTYGGGSSVSTVNNQSPDGSGNIVIDLQSVTDENNLTTNSIEIGETLGIPSNIPHLSVADSTAVRPLIISAGGDGSSIAAQNITLSSEININAESTGIVSINATPIPATEFLINRVFSDGSGTPEIHFIDDTSSVTNIIFPDGRMSGTDATNVDEFTTLSQLNTKQNSSAELTALSNLTTTSFLVRTGAATYATRTIGGTTNRIAVTNGTGLAGNITLDIGTSVVTLDAAQVLTNKTLTSPVLNIGSDANGDMYYRSGGVLVRIPLGTDGDVLTLVSGVPTWVTP